jgi:hypothetical protein
LSGSPTGIAPVIAWLSEQASPGALMPRGRNSPECLVFDSEGRNQQLRHYGPKHCPPGPYRGQDASDPDEIQHHRRNRWRPCRPVCRASDMPHPEQGHCRLPEQVRARHRGAPFQAACVITQGRTMTRAIAVNGARPSQGDDAPNGETRHGESDAQIGVRPQAGRGGFGLHWSGEARPPCRRSNRPGGEVGV